MSFVLGIIIGALFGLLVGGAFVLRYLRREIAANVGPQLRQLNYKIEALESVLNLVLVTRRAELQREHPSDIPGLRDRGTGAPVSQGPPGPDFDDEDEDDS